MRRDEASQESRWEVGGRMRRRERGESVWWGVMSQVKRGFFFFKREAGAKKKSGGEALLVFVYWLIECHGAVWRVKWVMSCHRTHMQTYTGGNTHFSPSPGRHPAVFLWKMNDFEAWMRGSFDSGAQLVYFPFCRSFFFQAAACTSEMRAKLDCLLRDFETLCYV